MDNLKEANDGATDFTFDTKPQVIRITGAVQNCLDLKTGMRMEMEMEMEMGTAMEMGWGWRWDGKKVGMDAVRA